MENSISFLFIFMITCVIAEVLVSIISESKEYHWQDSLTSFLIGLMAGGIHLVFRNVAFAYNGWLYDLAPFTIEQSVISWIVLILLSDFLTFLFHYVGHKCRLLWAVHSVHHSSEKYNLSTAVRVPVMNGFFRFLFWGPLSLLGFQPEMVIIADSVIFLYQFFLHTSRVGKLGWLEYFLNTPSHHRVHHGINEEYIDKNFGGILIIWDRIFGTFQSEQCTPFLWNQEAPGRVQPV